MYRNVYIYIGKRYYVGFGDLGLTEGSRIGENGFSGLGAQAAFPSRSPQVVVSINRGPNIDPKVLLSFILGPQKVPLISAKPQVTRVCFVFGPRHRHIANLLIKEKNR